LRASPFECRLINECGLDKTELSRIELDLASSLTTGLMKRVSVNGKIAPQHALNPISVTPARRFCPAQ